MKILVVATGGTIGSVKGDSIGLDSNCLKILDRYECEDVEFVGDCPFTVLSENITLELWQKLIDYLDNINFGDYDGVIILHGSDTLAYTSAIIANAFPNESIALVASDKPIEDESSNGISNFAIAVDSIRQGIDHPITCYDSVHNSIGITSANVLDEFVSIDTDIAPVCSRHINGKRVLVINSFVGFCGEYYDLSNVDAVLIGMYHSATAPHSVIDFAKNCSKPVYFVTHKSTAEYETAQGIDNIIFNCTLENALARLLLTN